MNPSIYYCLLAGGCLLAGLLQGSAEVAQQQQQQQEAYQRLRQNVSEEMHLITKSLEDLMGELTLIKHEATGRLSQVKNRNLQSDQERIRQTKVSRFVLSRVAELESESLSMHDELRRLFKLQPGKLAGANSVLATRADGRQEDQGDFEEPTTSTTSTTAQPSSSTTSTTSSTTTTAAAPSSSEGMPATTTNKPSSEEEEAAKLGFDMEALKKLGEEIGKRLDQFGKEAAKNLGDLLEGVKLVFRDPAKNQPATTTTTTTTTAAPPPTASRTRRPPTATAAARPRPNARPAGLLQQLKSIIVSGGASNDVVTSPSLLLVPVVVTAGAELESELMARQQQSGESLRGVHEQVIKLVDNMVQNYLGNVRRTIQRMTNFIDSRRTNQLINSQPKQALAPSNDYHQHQQPDPNSALTGQFVDGFSVMRQSILDRIQLLSKRMHDFTMQWTRAVGKQQSPLFDRIPPRGVELWRDFWDTVHKQVRRINQEFWQLSRDMSRMITGRLPSTGASGPQVNIVVRPNLYYATDDTTAASAVQQLQEFYDQMSAVLAAEQLRMDNVARQQHQQPGPLNKYEPTNNNNNLIDEQDDEMTKQELNRNVALRQQIQQEISIFGSIFDIMRAFIQRLRESASNVVRDVMQPSSSNNNNNDPVTPGPSVKPQVDKLLGETIDSQRQINSQARPVLLPNKRPTLIKE